MLRSLLAVRRLLPLALCCLSASPLAASTNPSGMSATTEPQPTFVDAAAAAVLHGAAPSTGKAAADTFYLYGGPGSFAGKFETSGLVPSRQGWIGVDLTEQNALDHAWHVSTFNAANLAAAPAYWVGPYTPPATNQAIWDGVPEGTAGYATAPGYGNNWHDSFGRRFTVSQPASPTTLTWEFVFNHDTEPGYDFFHVQWDSAGTWADLAMFDGDNRDSSGAFDTPRVFYASLTVQPGMYVGLASNEVHLRLYFDSDGAWSDEDGGWNTDGAVQADNIQVSGDNGIGLSQATFESGADGGWAHQPAGFVGDFSKVFPLVGCQFDACRQNLTPQMTFIDDGTPPNNDPLGRSTGGSISIGGYPLPDCWVVNYTGGLSDGELSLDNEVWSPPIDWDRPGGADDATEGGAFLRFTVYAHMPFTNGMFYVWHVRSWPDPGTGGWTDWRDRNLVYYSERLEFRLSQLDVRDLLVPAPTQVQVALGVKDLADLFAFPGNDATVAPCFDNVTFAKYEAAGPALTTRNIDIFQDGFAESGAAGCAAPDGDYAIRVDMARDIRPWAVPNAVAGDSMIVDIVARKPGAVVDTTSIALEFLLQTQNTDHFAAARASALAGMGATQIAPNKWRGTVAGRRSRTAGGAVIANRWYFDLPDGATTTAGYQMPESPLFFPGDQLRYFVRAATLNPSETALLPADTTGFESGSAYSRVFTIHGLPSLRFTGPTTCEQPLLLVWNELEHLGGEEELLMALAAHAAVEGRGYDVYTPKGPTSAVSNGLGGVHGASPSQLFGYNFLVFESGDLSSSLISDGSRLGRNDKGNDVALLTAWMQQAGHRGAAFWGDNIAYGLTHGGATFVYDVMRVSLVGDDVRPAIGNQMAPRVDATAAGVTRGYGADYLVSGSCPDINRFDNIQPGTGAVKLHEFLSPTGLHGYYTPAASVHYARTDTLAGQPYTRKSVTFPYGLCYIQDILGVPPHGGGRSARANVLREVLIDLGYPPYACPVWGCSDAPDVPAIQRLVVGPIHPNPFNPVTEFALTAPARGKVTVHLYNLRGERVATLLDSNLDAGEHRLQWRGVDGRGRGVASGVYLLEVSGFGQREVRKLALVR